MWVVFIITTIIIDPGHGIVIIDNDTCTKVKHSGDDKEIRTSNSDGLNTDIHRWHN